MGTVMFESDDFMYKMQFYIGNFWITIIMIQFAMYWNNKPKGRAKISGPG